MGKSAFVGALGSRYSMLWNPSGAWDQGGPFRGGSHTHSCCKLANSGPNYRLRNSPIPLWTWQQPYLSLILPRPSARTICQENWEDPRPSMPWVAGQLTCLGCGPWSSPWPSSSPSQPWSEIDLTYPETHWEMYSCVPRGRPTDLGLDYRSWSSSVTSFELYPPMVWGQFYPPRGLPCDEIGALPGTW